MQIRVVREPTKNATSLAALWIDGHCQCHTLVYVIRPAGEKVYGETAIPAGRYKLILSMSNRFKKIMPEVVAVPGFAGIRIHAGNTAKDTEGCLLLGQTRNVETRSIGQSKLAIQAFTTKITAVWDAKGELWITYVNPV